MLLNPGSKISILTNQAYALGDGSTPARVYNITMRATATSQGTMTIYENTSTAQGYATTQAVLAVEAFARWSSDLNNSLDFGFYGLLFPNGVYVGVNSNVAYHTVVYEVLPK